MLYKAYRYATSSLYRESEILTVRWVFIPFVVVHNSTLTPYHSLFIPYKRTAIIIDVNLKLVVMKIVEHPSLNDSSYHCLTLV